jgi:hypothetical protein
MNEKLARVAIVINVVVVVAIFVLYNKNEELQKQLDNVYEEQSVQDARTADIGNSQMSLKDRLTELGNSLENAHKTANSNVNKIRTNSDDFAAWKAELVNDVESKVIDGIIEQGANEAVRELATNPSLVFSDQFKEEIADIISAKYVERLRGNPGVDADNEVIANLLRSDVDFLDRVSVNAVLGE